MLDTTSRPLLEIAGLEAWYGESHILHGVDFNVRQGEVVCLLGRNGAGNGAGLFLGAACLFWRLSMASMTTAQTTPTVETSNPR